MNSLFLCVRNGSLSLFFLPKFYDHESGRPNLLYHYWRSLKTWTLQLTGSKMPLENWGWHTLQPSDLSRNTQLPSTYLLPLDILFPSNRNIHKSSCGLCFWASVPLIDRFYWNLSIKGSEAGKQRPHELLWMLWFDEKSISNLVPLQYVWLQNIKTKHEI